MELPFKGNGNVSVECFVNQLSALIFHFQLIQNTRLIIKIQYNQKLFSKRHKMDRYKDSFGLQIKQKLQTDYI